MAAGAVDIKVRGVKQLDAGARRLFENIEHAEARDGVGVTAQQTAATVRARVPRRSGRLAASVRVEQGEGARASVKMGEGVVYARWIEYGGGRGRPYRKGGRYVYPTAKRTERAFRKHAETVCTGEIRRMTWPNPGP